MNVKGFNFTSIYGGMPTTSGSGTATQLTNSAGIGKRESMLLLSNSASSGSGAVGTITLWESSASAGTFTAVDTDTITDISADGVQAVGVRVTKPWVQLRWASATTGAHLSAVLIHLKRTV